MTPTLGALAAREATISKTLEMLFDGTLVVQQGVIIETNRGLLSMTGYSASELVGRKIEEIPGWQDLGKALTRVTGECVSLETSLPRKSSHPVFATVRAERVSRSGSTVVIAVVTGMQT